MIRLLYKDVNCKVSISISEDLNLPMAHIEINGWSLSLYKRYLLVIGSCLNLIKEEGVLSIYAIARTEKAQKFNSLFGFSPISDVIDKETNNIYKLMRLEC